MVHTRNGSNYSVQPDGSGNGTGKTRARSGKSSSTKTFLEDSRVASHSPRSVPTNFDVNSGPELIQGNILRAEPFPSGRNRNILVPVQTLVQSHQGREVGSMSKPLAGGHELLLTHQELSGSGGWSSLSCKDKFKKIKNWLKNQSLLSIYQKKELEMTPALEREIPGVSTSSKPAPEMLKHKPKGPQKKNQCPKSHQGKGKGKAKRHRPYP
ncbi:hypothetical protein O181_086439 [Austropuccinia psidii MF-1]|uniref:Uncharacterized protein n=1 Tax=Austropuccinia psidii MF-1 TaxID=1389203 RepID=A0A9Q3FX38_9BASI|nr:hypothetical protein [Austropuccinia psidii MF-1]